jgi:cytochrome c biogenesis protein CcdA|tara:strand:- start:2055 stop:2417 length:363 start_codon:yes stop_codon:yes gene_type:complete
MNSRERRELRGYIGSGVVFAFVILLLLFLSSVEIPQTNNDTFKLIVGALVATIGASVFVFIGKDDQQLVELQRRNDSLETKVDSLISQKDQLEGMIIKMQDDLIDRVFLKVALDKDFNKK